MSINFVRQTLRNLFRSPSFLLSAVLTLALGMTATTIIFSTYHSLVLRPLPYAEWQNLHTIWQQRDGGMMMTGPSRGLVQEILRGSTTLSGVAAYTSAEHSLTGRGEPVILAGAEITAGLPELLRVAPLIGRTFTQEEVDQGARVVLLGERLWRDRFGAATSVLGTTITLGPDSWTVIGVMPRHFGRYEDYGAAHEYWLPLRWENVRFGMSALARLRPGVEAEAAGAELNAVAAGLTAGEASHGQGWEYVVRSVAETTGGRLNPRRAVPPLFVAAGLLLLIGCANVAGLLLVRLHARRREFAVRAALGARARHLIGELAAEQFTIALFAGALAVVLAVWGVDLIRAVRPEQLAVLDNVALSVPALAFAGALVLLTTLLFGTLPALAVARSDLAGSIQSAGGPRLTSGNRTRSVLVTLQLALSTLLLVAGFLLVRTMYELERRELGFAAENLLVASIPLPEYRYDAAARETFMGALAGQLAETPGIEAVAISGSAPPQMGVMFVPQLEVEGSDATTNDVRFLKGGGIGPGYLSVLGARIGEGREYSAAEAGEVAVVNRSFAERFWPGGPAVGRRFRLSPDQPWQTVIGVVEDLRLDGPLHMSSEPMMFWPMSYQVPGATLTLRTAGDPLAAIPALRQTVMRLDADMPVRELATMERRMAGTIASQRFSMIMIGLFAAAAAALCAVGLYGLVSYSFELRVREVGIRTAVGATPRRIRALFLSQAIRLVAIGVPVGLITAFASASLMSALVHGVSPRDPLAYLLALAVVSVVVLPAGWLPARRASRADPVEALRRE